MRSLETIQKAVVAFVTKVETKVDKILREFIFRSGARLLTDPSEPHTQATQSQEPMSKYFPSPSHTQTLPERRFEGGA